VCDESSLVEADERQVRRHAGNNQVPSPRTDVVIIHARLSLPKIAQEESWGIGNVMRSFAGAFAYSLWTGRQLLLNFPLLERNFEAPRGRRWFPPGAQERSKVRALN
jgi:hypothetical protein